MNRISDTTLTSLLDLKKHLAHVKNGNICWKMYDLEIPASDMFKSLSDKNKNRVLYYGVTVLDNALKEFGIEKITEILDMDTYYDTETKENVSVIFIKSFKSVYAPGTSFSRTISIFTNEQADQNFKALLNDSITQYSATCGFLDLAALLLCNFKFNDGVIDTFTMQLKKMPQLDTMDKVINQLFFEAKLPEPTINYLSKGEARVMRG